MSHKKNITLHKYKKKKKYKTEHSFKTTFQLNISIQSLSQKGMSKSKLWKEQIGWRLGNAFYNKNNNKNQ